MSTMAAWVSRTQGSMQGAQKGNPQGGRHLGFSLWAAQRSGFVMEAMRIRSSRAYRMGLTRTAGGSIGSGEEGLSRA